MFDERAPLLRMVEVIASVPPQPPVMLGNTAGAGAGAGCGAGAGLGAGVGEGDGATDDEDELPQPTRHTRLSRTRYRIGTFLPSRIDVSAEET